MPVSTDYVAIQVLRFESRTDFDGGPRFLRPNCDLFGGGCTAVLKPFF